MAKHYRPFLLARAGELAGLRRQNARLGPSCSPVFRIPERSWDYENNRYSKSHEDHISGVPEKLATAWPHGLGYVDLSLLDADDPVHGRHPLQYIIDEANSRTLALTPLVNSASTAGHLAAAVAVHSSLARGVAIQLPQTDWTTINAGALAGLMSKLALTPGDIDVIIDFEDADGPVTEIAVVAELASLRSIGDFRSVTVGGNAFPDLSGVPKGTTEYPRKEWGTYAAVQRKLRDQKSPTPDFFDHAVQNPELIELGVNPRYLSISASFRYAVGDKWLVAKGNLFKGRGTSSQGGAALVDPLATLVRHPDYATPVRSIADDWINDVITGADSPGAPQKWREWATVRHLDVAVFQLSTLA